MTKAEKIWENQVGKELFRYVETGGVLTLNLIYDTRQATTDTLQQIDSIIVGKQATYDTLKWNYTILNQKFQTEQTQYEREWAELETMKNAFEKKVAYWNQQWGAPESEYSQIHQEQKDISQLN